MIQSALLEHDEKPDLFNTVGNITVNMKGGIMSFGVIVRVFNLQVFNRHSFIKVEITVLCPKTSQVKR